MAANPERKIYKNIITVFCSIIFAIIFMEALLWLFLQAPGDYRVKFKQNLPGLKKEIVYSRNHYDFRALSMKNEKKDPRTIRIFCIGASTTMQDNQNTVETWSGILEQRLNNAFFSKGVNIEIAAAGSGGDKVWRGYRFCKYRLPRFDADIVITLFGINDLAWQGGANYFYEGKKDRIKNIELQEKNTKQAAINKQRNFSLKKRLKIVLKKHSQIYNWVSFIRQQVVIRKHIETGAMLDWCSENLPKLRKKYNGLPYKEELFREPDPIIEFRDGLQQAISCLKEQDIETIILAQPVLWKNDLSESEKKALWFETYSKDGPVRMSGRWLENEMKRYDLIQKELAEENNQHYIPLDLLMPKTLDYFFDDCHFTDKGSYAMASAIYPTLLLVVRKIAIKRRLMQPLPQ